MGRPIKLTPAEIAAFQLLNESQRRAFMLKTKRKRIGTANDILRRR